MHLEMMFFAVADGQFTDETLLFRDEVLSYDFFEVGEGVLLLLG